MTPLFAAGLISQLLLADDLSGYTRETTAASVFAGFTGTQGAIFGSIELTFVCDGTAVPMLKNIRSAQFNMAVSNADGSIAESKNVDAGVLFS